MTLENRILRDLIAGQSTARSTADRLGIDAKAAEVVMDRLVKEGTLLILIIEDTITVYRLTPATRQAIADAGRFHQQQTA
jgi:DNA-binding MarR family transcriptional regulator